MKTTEELKIRKELETLQFPSVPMDFEEIENVILFKRQLEEILYQATGDNISAMADYHELFRLNQVLTTMIIENFIEVD